jgi:hypothetical protein
MRDDGYEILKLAQALDAEKRSIFIARCIWLLIEKDGYDSPLFCSYEFVGVRLLVKAICTPTIGFENVELLAGNIDLNAVERSQNEEILSAQATFKDLKTHDDGPLAEMNVSRAESAAIIVRWVIKVKEQKWQSPQVPKEIGDLLFEKWYYWIPKFRLVLQETSRFVKL